MSPTTQNYLEARFHYRKVNYLPYGVGPGDPLVLTADPWSFLYAWIKGRIPKSRGRNRRRFERALYFSGLAEQFHRASQTTELPIKGTLVYYSILNLVKAFISVRGVDLERSSEHHGINLAPGKIQTVHVPQQPQHSTGVFHEFVRLLGTPVAGQSDVSLNEIFSNIPELHEMAFGLGLLPWTRPKYLPINIRFLVNEAKTHLSTEIRYSKHSQTRVDAQDNFYRGARKEYFRAATTEDVELVYVSKGRKRFSQDNWDRIYRNICKDYSRFNLATILTRSGHRHYCDLKPSPFHPLAYSFMALFYIGTVARYKPTETQGVLDSKWRPLISESVATCPSQLLYQLVSLTTGKTCVVPLASLA